MNKNRLDFILSDIKPDDCSVEFLSDVSLAAPYGSCYRSDIKTIFIVPLEKHLNAEPFIAKLTNQERFIFQERALLHEIGHHITWNTKWRLYGHFDGMITDSEAGHIVMCSDNLYSAEYLAESFFRIQCRKYGWFDLLTISNKAILSQLENMIAPIPNSDPWGYGYMALRITREEGL